MSRFLLFQRFIVSLLIACALIALSGPVPANAQSARPWTAWIYTPLDGSISQVAPNGAITGQIFLPLTQAYNAYNGRIVVSPSGRYVAYTVYDNTLNPANTQLFVYDTALGSITFAFDLSDAAITGFDPFVGFPFAPESTAFDEANGQFAFGYLRASDSHWRVIVGDLAGGTVFASLLLESAPSEVAALGASFVPVVRRYDGQRVMFTMVRTGTELGPSQPAFNWDIGTGAVNPNGIYASLEAATLPATGEVIIPSFDNTLPHPDLPEGPVWLSNTLDVFIPATGERFAFYAENEGIVNLRKTYLIEDGARILAETENIATGAGALRVLNRDGGVAGELVGTLETIKGTPDGFVGMFNSANGPALGYVNTIAGNYTPVTLWTGGGDSQARLAAVVASGQPPTSFGAWGRLD